ncbi:MAG: AAA family ATPase [Chloroflexi bacterium]|nr:AAA family ATPase [Chloroflexota bacterium]
MGASLAGRIEAIRLSQFVGRTAEQMLLQSALGAETLPFNIVYIYGPGGVGKSTLLRTFAQQCARRAIPSLYLDLRNVEPSPDAFSEALRRVLNLNADDSAVAAMTAYATPFALLLDTYELAQPLDEWLREVFVPQLPANVLCVLAGRNPLSAPWRADPGLQSLLRVIPLHNLNPDESREYLQRRGVPVNRQEAVLAFTHGHPLALSLVADAFAQRGDFDFQPEATPDVVKTLLEHFVQHVPGPAHRAALEVCSLVRLTTESLLASALDTPDVHDLFEWLRSLSFIEGRREGLFPHDLAREALVTDLRWRNPEWHTELHRRARTYYVNRLSQVAGQEQQRFLFDLIYLHRYNPVMRPFFDWQAGGSLTVEAMRPEDYGPIRAMVTKHEGEESSLIAKYWLSRLPQQVLVCRDHQRQPCGFMLLLPLHEVGEEGAAFDPAVAACWKYLKNHAPLRSGEVATLFRFWMSADEYQHVSPVQSLIAVNAARHYLFTPGLAYTFLPCADPAFWQEVMAYTDQQRIASADFTVGDRRYGMFGHDWRAVPPVAWLERLAEREVGHEPDAAPTTAVRSLVVLSEADFGSAVRDALRDFTQADNLRANPLLQSRLVIERAGSQARESERVTALQSLIRSTADRLRESHRMGKAYKALYHTYFQPAPTQEQAAELVDLPFSTYRRHLKHAITWITDTLWQMEVGSMER